VETELVGFGTEGGENCGVNGHTDADRGPGNVELLDTLIKLPMLKDFKLPENCHAMMALQKRNR
jgi:hypothetical protein